MLPVKRTVYTANCAVLHIALRTAVTVQHSDYSSDMHTTEHLQHTDTFTVTTGADIDRRSTVDPPHSTQFPVLTAVAQFDCTEQTAYCKGRGSLSDTALRKGTHAQNKDRLKKQSETAEGEVKLHREFNKGPEFSQNCNFERGQLAELVPNSDSDGYSSAADSGKHVELSGDSASG